MKTATPPRPRARVRSSAPAAPPLPRHGDDAEGADVLRELPGATGVLLWGALRDVLLWVDAPAAERRGLFAYGAASERRDDIARSAPDPELWAPLLTMAEMTGAPERADPARLAYACRAICRWAERRGATGTRLAFAEAAALVQAESPRLALEAARLARDLARYAPAEGWFRPANRRARGSDWESYAWGYIGLGVLYMRTGNYPAARTVIGRALRAAAKRRLRALEAVASHHMFTFVSEAYNVAEAYQWARRALETYGPDNPRVPALAHDIAVFWADLGAFARAVPVIEAILPQLTDRAEHLLATSSLLRTVAGAGDMERYRLLRREVLIRMESAPAETRLAEVHLNLARAAACTGEWDEAEAQAIRGLHDALRRDDAWSRMTAEAELESLRARKTRTASRSVAEPPPVARQADRLASALLQSLQPASAAA